MFKRTPLFMAVEPQLVGSGVQPDLHLMQKLLWERSENVSFMNGRVRRLKPNTELFEAGADAIRGITQQQDSNGVRWVWAASGADVVRWYGPSVEAIYTGTWQEDESVLYKASFWDMLPFGDWVILNSMVGPIKVYKPGTGIESLGDAPEDVVAVRKMYNFLVAFGYGASQTRVGWSDADDFTTWTAAADNLAGSLTVAEFNTPIRAVVTMAEAQAIFAEDQMAMFTYVGSPFYFGYKMRLDGIGAIGKASVATDGKNAVGVGRNGVWWTDGMTYRYIDEGFLHDYLQDNVNWDQGSKIVACRNDVTGCFDFCFPMTGSLVPNEAWSYDPRQGGWTQIPVFSMKDERRLFRKPIVGTLAGAIELDNDATSGNALVLETKPLLAMLQNDPAGRDNAHLTVRVQELDLMLKAATAVEWRLGAAQEPTGPFNYCPWVAGEAGAVTYKIPMGLPSGVYHKLELRSTEAIWDLDLQGFMLFGQVEGVKRAAP